MKKRIFVRVSSAALCSVLFSGCGSSLFVSPKEQPVIIDRAGVFKDGPLATISVTPERRIAYVNIKQGDEKYGQFCAEPPADVAESLSSAFRAGLEAAVSTQTEVNVQAAAEIARQIKTSVQSLAQRSQGIMYLRDGGFRLCELYLNGVLEGEDFALRLDDILTHSRELIEIELAGNSGKIGYGAPLALEAPELDKLESLFLGRLGVEDEDKPEVDDSPLGKANAALDRLDDPRLVAPSASADQIRLDQAQRILESNKFTTAILADNAEDAKKINAGISDEKAASLQARAKGVLQSCPGTSAEQLNKWTLAIAKYEADNATKSEIEHGLTCPPAS